DGHAAYTDRFLELARLVPHIVTPEGKRIKRYMYGIDLQIRGMGRGNQGNQEKGRAFILGEEKARHDSNIMTDIEPSDLGFNYETEIASGQLVEIDKVIRGCKLEIEVHMFDINLIPFGSRSFDVIIRMDWLSDRKAEIICHVKVVRIPLLDSKVLRVLGEKPKEKVRWLMCAKAKEKKQEEIVVIELVPEEMPVEKSPYRLAPSEFEELSGQLKELQDKGALVPTHVNLLPLRKRFRDSYSLGDSVEEDIDVDVLVDIKADAMTAETTADIDAEAGIDASIGIGKVTVAVEDLHLLRDGLTDDSEKESPADELDFIDGYMMKNDLKYNALMKNDLKMNDQKMTGGATTCEMISEDGATIAGGASRMGAVGKSKVEVIKDRLKAVRDRKKSYADKMRKPLEFSVGDYVLLKVSPWKGVVRFRKKKKLAPRFVEPFEIIKKVGPVAYRLDFPEELDGLHDTFHLSNLKKCLADPTLQVPLDEIRVDDKLNFVEEPVEILEREFKS
nr:reverse transcriptase domain-containing protein [Tanacetum cinerariifolium]